MAVACIALFVAMGGVSYGVATGSIDSRELKDGSVRNRDFKDGTLRGQEAKRDGFGGRAIKESALGKVPDSDKLGGSGAAKYTTRWALVNAQGQIERQSGGFSLVNCYQANANCYLDAGEDVTNNGVFAEINASNTPDATRLNGETGTAPCGQTSVNCAPPGTETNNVIVVTPRNSDGSTTDAATRFRFYVYVTGTDGQ